MSVNGPSKVKATLIQHNSVENYCFRRGGHTRTQGAAIDVAEGVLCQTRITRDIVKGQMDKEHHEGIQRGDCNVCNMARDPLL